ncbi:MAG TPA: glycosyltransferase [Solirubrobacterales bacterium]|nr:glycosyltransferase [Solirubrobacterales bacterium]
MAAAEAPLVSVVLRTYNHEPFIAQAIESVLIQQAPFPFELVIGEDCSTDGTRRIVSEYAAANPGVIRTVLPERNLGHGEIFRRALEATSGSLIAYLDGDDYWSSSAKLARQVEFLKGNPECASCFHDVSLIYDEAGLPSGTVSPRFAERLFSLEQVVMECFVPAPSMMFRREVLARLSSWVFDSAWIDWLIHIRSAELGRIGYLPEALAVYRVHKGGMFSALDRVSQLEEDVRFYERLLPELPEEEELIERCLAYRQVQLAIERLGVPFGACVVLVDPRREFRPYFNGRHARNLPRREGQEVSELEAIREASASLPAAVRDYGSAAQEVDGSGGCYVCVPRNVSEWLSSNPQLFGYLADQGEVAWSDEHVVVYELADPLDRDGGAGGRGARRVEVEIVRDPSLAGSYLDAPANGALLPAHAITVVGWALGADGLIAAVEFEAGREVIWRTPVNTERPDVARAFPHREVSTPGFQTTLNVQDLSAGGRVTAFAVAVDGTRAPFAVLRFNRPGEEEPAAA